LPQSSKKVRDKTTRRAARQTSNVFAMFDQKQIAEFKEAFSMIDHDNDGFIDKEDLKDMLASLGQNATDEYIDEMLSEAPGQLNFTMFLTLMGEKLSGTDPEHEIIQAFECFDEASTGFISAKDLREFMTTMGNRFTNEQVPFIVIPFLSVLIPMHLRSTSCSRALLPTRTETSTTASLFASSSTANKVLFPHLLLPSCFCFACLNKYY